MTEKETINGHEEFHDSSSTSDFRQKILIVDDRVENLVVLERTLADVDAEVIKAMNGNEALAASLEHDFAIAILDIMMPGMDGYELAEYLRGDKKTAVLPIIFLTASFNDDQHMFKGYESGGVDYIVKPYSPDVLLSKVRIFLEVDRYRKQLETMINHRTRHIRHITRIMRGIRDVNQLIVREKDRDRLIQRACELLVAARSFRYAWIILVDQETGEIVPAQAGLPKEKFDYLIDMFKSGSIPNCCLRSLNESRVVIPEPGSLDCENCFLGDFSGDTAAFTARLFHKGKEYGFISARLPEGFDVNEEEISLFEESAEDISYALFGIEQERACSESEKTLSSIFDNATDGILLADLDTLRLKKANRAIAEMLGYSRQELLERSISDIYSSDKIPDIEFLLEKMKTGEKKRASEISMRKKDDSAFLAEVSFSLVVLDDRKYLLGIFRDITESRKLEAQLQQAQKMESIGRLAGGVAHDFNNLLTVINGYSEITMSELEEGDPIRNSFEQILHAGQSATALTQQLLAFSRKQIISPVVVDLNEVVERSKKMLKRLIGEDIDLAFFPGANLWRVRIDPNQIDQILMNLSVNARDAMPEFGKLTIETRNMLLTEKQCQSCMQPIKGDFVMLAISDTGMGIDGELLKEIFEPFFTSKEKGKGTGLGLSTVHGIVHQNEGHINVYSEPGVGTTFKIYLPREFGEDCLEEESPEPVSLTGDETILLVEDMENLRKMARSALEENGYRVMEAGDGEEALLISQRMADLDLLLTDVIMPKISGKQLFEKLQETRKNFQVLYMSGYTENSIAHHGVLEKGTNFIHKPFRPQDLVRMVRQVLDKAVRPAAGSVPRKQPRKTILLIAGDERIRSLYGKYAQSLDMILLSTADEAEGVRLFRKHLDRLSLAIVNCPLPEMAGPDLIAELLKVSDQIPIIVSSRQPLEDTDEFLQSECVKCIQQFASDLKRWFTGIVSVHSLDAQPRKEKRVEEGIDEFLDEFLDASPATGDRLALEADSILSTLPQSVVGEMIEAAESGDSVRIRHVLANNLMKSFPEFASVLKRLIDKYDYDRIIELLKANVGEGDE